MVKSNQIKTFWIAFFGIIAALAIALCVGVSVKAATERELVRMSVVSDENQYKISQENSYKQSLYLACDSLKNLDANLGKAAVSSSSSNQARQLTNVVVCAESVNRQLADLPIAQGDKLAACLRFVNQTQDYASYLVARLAEGEGLTDAERGALVGLDKVAKNMYELLQGYAEGDSGLFIVNGNGSNGVGALTDELNDTDDSAFAYEKLIYDGPFSESIQQKTLPCDGKLTVKQVGERVEKLFGKSSFDTKMNVKEGLLYRFNTVNGVVTLTCDGYVYEYEALNQANAAPKCEACIAMAEEFCAKLGYDVTGVWISRTQDSVTYVNCAPVIDGVIFYPQLIKVAVSAEGVVGLEARSYLLNRGMEPQGSFGTVSSEDAQECLIAAAEVTNVARAYIEKNGSGYYCWELECAANDEQYYVYVDSNTGKEVQIFKVIANTEGHTVI